MSEQVAATEFDRLQEKAVKYAIAVEARDAIQAQLKYWIAVAAVFGAIAGWFGYSLHREVSQLNATIVEQKKRLQEVEAAAEKVNIALKESELDLERLGLSIKERQSDAREFYDRIEDRAVRISDRALEFDAVSQRKLAELDRVVGDSKSRVSEIETKQKEAEILREQLKQSATEVRESATNLNNVSQRATEFDRSIEAQRQVFRNALLDYVMLTRKATSPELILSTADPSLHYRVVFRTPSDIRRDGFLLSYDVKTCRSSAGSNECDQVLESKQYDKVVKYQRNQRDWFSLDGTNGGYQYAVDYIFTAKLARNYVTIRIGATDKLLPHLSAYTQVAAGGK